MIAPGMFFRLLFWIGKDHLPRLALVLAAPECCIAGVNDGRISRIKSEGGQSRPKVEHPPGVTTVSRDVSARHITMLNYKPWIAGADCRANHCASTAWPNHSPGIQAPSRSFAP